MSRVESNNESLQSIYERNQSQRGVEIIENGVQPVVAVSDLRRLRESAPSPPPQQRPRPAVGAPSLLARRRSALSSSSSVEMLEERRRRRSHLAEDFDP